MLDMKTLTEVLDKIGREKLAQEVGVKMPAIRKAERSGVAPAMWYDAMERLAKRKLPRTICHFKGKS